MHAWMHGCTDASAEELVFDTAQDPATGNPLLRRWNLRIRFTWNLNVIIIIIIIIVIIIISIIIIIISSSSMLMLIIINIIIIIM